MRLSSYCLIGLHVVLCCIGPARAGCGGRRGGGRGGEGMGGAFQVYSPLNGRVSWNKISGQLQPSSANHPFSSSSALNPFHSLLSLLPLPFLLFHLLLVLSPLSSSSGLPSLSYPRFLSSFLLLLQTDLQTSGDLLHHINQ